MFLFQRTILLAHEKINEIIVSFAKLQYDAFDPANGHHWTDHVSWFKRRVTAVEAAYDFYVIIDLVNVIFEDAIIWLIRSWF
jgi:hypothetical protein